MHWDSNTTTLYANCPPQKSLPLLQGHFVIAEGVTLQRGGGATILAEMCQSSPQFNKTITLYENCPVKWGHPSYKAILLQKGWPYKKGGYHTGNDMPKFTAFPHMKMTLKYVLFHIFYDLI
jgi:hypothetical protein